MLLQCSHYATIDLINEEALQTEQEALNENDNIAYIPLSILLVYS